MRGKRIRFKKEGTLCKKMHNVLFLTARGRGEKRADKGKARCKDSVLFLRKRGVCLSAKKGTGLCCLGKIVIYRQNATYNIPLA